MSNVTTTTVKTVRNNKKVTRRNKRRAPKRRNVSKHNIPLAYATRQRKPYYKISKSRKNAQEVEIEGEDLIIPAPEVQTEGPTNSEFFLTMPANPLYWTGTRLAGLAAVYQQYRPLRFDVEYIPQVPVTTPGQVICGTLWNTSIPDSNLQQTLMSSNGGCMTQCYQRVHSHVICDKKTLPFDLYNMRDDMSHNSTNPFTWCAHYTGGSTTNAVNQPGWIYVKWRYRLSVGLGSTPVSTNVYNETTNTDITTARDRMNLPNALFPGWGVTFDIIKALVKPILRKTAIFILKRVIAKLEEGQNADVEYPINPGNTLTFDGYVGEYARCKDTDGRSYLIPTSSRIVMYTTGTSPETLTAEPTAQLALGQDFTIQGTELYNVMKSSPGVYLLYITPSDFVEAKFEDNKFMMTNGNMSLVRFEVDVQLEVNGSWLNTSYLDYTMNGTSYFEIDNINTQTTQQYLDNWAPNPILTEEELSLRETPPPGRDPQEKPLLLPLQGYRNIKVIEKDSVKTFPIKKRLVRCTSTPPM